jgi:putative membrane protein
MKASLILTAMAGLAVAGFLIVHHGVVAIGETLAAAGLAGLVAVSLWHLTPIVLCGLAWRALLGPALPEAQFLFIWARWIRDGVGSVLAILSISGELAALRVLALHGLRPLVGGASVVVDLTAELLTLALLSLVALGLLFLTRPDAPNLAWISLGVLMSSLVFIGYFVAQVKGLFRLLDRISRRLVGEWQPIQDVPAGALHEQILSLYRDRAAFTRSCLLHLLAWLAAGGEVWLALQFMGRPLGLVQALSLGALVSICRALGFMVPWSAGVQEGAYLLVGAMYGLGADTALSLSLLRRGRDLVIGIPAVLAWEYAEGWRLWRRLPLRVKTPTAIDKTRRAP